MDPRQYLQTVMDQLEPDQAAIYADSVGRNAQYRVLTLALDTAKLSTQPYKIGFGFRSFFVMDASDTDVSISMQISSQDNSQDALTLRKNNSLKFPHAVNSCFLYWAAQASKTITIVFFLTGEFASNQFVQTTTGGLTLFDGTAVTPQAAGSSSSTASLLFASSSARKMMMIQNLDSVPIFISGDSSLTDDTGAMPGIRLNPGESYEWRSSSACYVISSSTVTSKIGLNLHT